MTEQIANQMVLNQTTAADAVGVTREYLLPPGNGVLATLLVINLGGTSPLLTFYLDVSNDRVNWSQEGVGITVPSSVGYYEAAVPELAARWMRARFTLGSTASNGVAVLSVTARRAQL